MKFILSVLFSTLLISSVAMAQQGTRTVFLIRHAENASATLDAPLTPAGEKRASCLATLLKEAGIKQIYVTDAKRTQQTAAPLAAALKLTPTVVPAKDPNTLIKDVLYSGGGNILVVGHSDTLPFIVARLKAGSVTPIGENEYNRLLIVTIVEGGATQASTLRYCECGVTPATGTPKAPPAKTGKKAPVPRNPDR